MEVSREHVSWKSCILENADAEAELGRGWADTPAPEPADRASLLQGTDDASGGEKSRRKTIDAQQGTEMVKAAFYARGSKIDPHCEVQVSDFREFIERHGWETVREYVDADWSRARASRPEFSQLKADAAQHLFDVVVVWSLDRLGRSTLDCLQGIQELNRQGIRFLTLTQPIDTDVSNPISNFLMKILDAVEQLEREMIRERITAGLNRAKAKGIKLGRRPVVFDRAQVIELRQAGASVRQIAGKLRISRSVVQRALQDWRVDCP